jgi:putative flavoprotein involved in K+ transport
MKTDRNTEHVQIVVIGGGQSGLSVGYCLQRAGLTFVILEANAHVGDSWRLRWDLASLVHPGAV